MVSGRDAMDQADGVDSAGRAGSNSSGHPLVERLARRLVVRSVPPGREGRQAAVAVVLHESADLGPRVLLMKRAERAGDPWSGQISLPGGGYHADDGDLVTTAIRETREELLIDLATLPGTRVLGHLPPLHPSASGPRGIAVTPFVFATTVQPEPSCGPEAEAAFWLPLARAARGELDATFLYPGTGNRFPSWEYEGHTIWGLTMRILADMLDAARRDAPPGI